MPIVKAIRDKVKEGYVSNPRRNVNPGKRMIEAVALAF